MTATTDNDDIAMRYRRFAARCDHGLPNGLGDAVPAPTECGRCSMARDAADEIGRLREGLQDAAMHAEQDACAIEQLREQIKALVDERDYWQRQANA